MASPLLTLLYMSFPKRLIALRKAKGHTQASLAEASGIHVQQIKRYELGNAQPSVDALVKLAKTLSITTDELLFDEAERGPGSALKLHFEAVSKLSPDEQDTIIEVIDGMLLKHEAQRWSRPRKRASG